GVVVDTRSDEHRPVDAALVHLEQELLDSRAAARIRHRRLIRPGAPRMAVRVEDHDTNYRTSLPAEACANLAVQESPVRDSDKWPEALLRGKRVARRGGYWQKWQKGPWLSMPRAWRSAS